jgi:hypothetical protein
MQDKKRAALMKLAFFTAGTAAIFAYVYSVIEPELIYHAQGRMIEYEHFELTRIFFVDSFFSISGAVHYFSAFLTQLFYYPLAGSAIISGMCLALCLLTYKVIQRSGILQKIPVVAFIPAILMLVGYNRYRNHTEAFLSIIVAVTVFLLYDKIRKQNRLPQAAVFVVLFFILFWLSGQGCLIFSMLCALSQKNKNQMSMAVFFVLFALAFYGVCNGLLKINFPFSQIVASARDGEDPFVNKSYYLCIFTIAAAVLWGSCERRLVSGKKDNRGGARKHKTFAAVSMLIVNVLILSAVSYSSLAPSFFRNKKHLLKVGDYSVREQWDELVAYCKKYPVRTKHYLQLHDINYALFKKDRLLEDMFQFPQNHKALLLNTENESREIFYRTVRIMYELGYVGLSQKYAHEMQNRNGNEPEILYSLALIYLAKDNPETATHFLNKLKKSIAYKERAEQILKCIQDGTYLSPLAGSVINNDQVNFSFKTEVFFGDLLRKNPQNKMAMDYMMAFFLLTKQTDKIAQYVPIIYGLEHEKLPKAIRQALIIHKLAMGEQFDLSAYGVPDAELKSAKDFLVAIKSRSFQYNEDFRAEILNRNKDSYYYYYSFTKLK